MQNRATRVTEAVRAELRAAVYRRYSSSDELADAVGIPRKSFYRYVTIAGKDRAKTVPLQVYLTVFDYLHATFGDEDFDEMYARIKREVK